MTENQGKNQKKNPLVRTLVLTIAVLILAVLYVLLIAAQQSRTLKKSTSIIKTYKKQNTLLLNRTNQLGEQIKSIKKAVIELKSCDINIDKLTALKTSKTGFIKNIREKDGRYFMDFDSAALRTGKEARKTKSQKNCKHFESKGYKNKDICIVNFSDRLKKFEIKKEIDISTTINGKRILVAPVEPHGSSLPPNEINLSQFLEKYSSNSLESKRLQSAFYSIDLSGSTITNISPLYIPSTK